jgi:20S proteasome alpha/beta subunit
MPEKNIDRRKAFRGYKGAVVAGDKRAVTAYLLPITYEELISLAEAKGQSVSGLVGDAIAAYVARKASQDLIK